MYHLRNFARKNPKKVALFFSDSNQSYTYEELDARANKAANALLGMGLKSGDCIAICIENCIELLDISFGAQRIGLYYVLVSTKFSAKDVDYIVSDSGAKLFILSKRTEAGRGVEDGLVQSEHMGVDWGAATKMRWDYFFQKSSEALPDLTAPGREMLYTSGTTGRPKGVRKPAFIGAFDRVDERNLHTAKKSFIDENCIYLSTSPLYHAAPNRYLSAVINFGGTAVIMQDFDASQALMLIEKYRCTHSLWVPTMFHRLLRLPQDIILSADTSSMMVAMHGAAPCPIHVKEAMIEWWGPVLYEYYSGTEGVGATSITSEEWLCHKGSVGKSKDGIIHILDESGVELPPGQTGKVYFESNAVFEYWQNERKTKEISSAEGWRSFGDVGYLDSDGYLYLQDREDFLINSAGVKVHPQEIEDFLLKHPSIIDAAVFGLPSAEYGQEVVAVLDTGENTIDTDVVTAQILEMCRAEFGPIKTPKKVYFDSELPRHPTGKLFKRELIEKYSLRIFDKI